MGFKKLNENDFVNAARGETSITNIEEVKRKKAIIIYLTEEEVAELKQQAVMHKMSRAAYIRFKLFVKS